MTRVAERSPEQRERDRESNRQSQIRRRARIRAEHAAGLIEIPDAKKCGYCGKVRPAAEFSRSTNSHDGLYGHCRECDRATSRVREQRYRAEDPEGWKQRRAIARRKHRYGVTDAEFALLAEAQEFCCAVCGQADELCVDHCHDTGAVRGLLCKSCNSGIGMLADDPARIAAALAYLLKGE